ncbi:hypothetical protein [Hymenobacter coccineus]|uniref:STAS/SEC14 domain-containing protein n=1 Tax=Hymenobacter coccineus TaxID=1908235 RepID=A0A1G1TBQ0_9BACT|nr:hypothetical protein [Hymenobacter coccineus]OGX88300.1 hypothetical protein BEN49_10270 [Hymenobacter coccineus]
MQTLVSLPFLNVHLHNGGPFATLETEWLGFAGSNDFRNALTETLRLAQQYHVKGWVADDRRLGAVRPKDLEWAHANLLKPVSLIGLQRFAHLESVEVLNRVTIDGMYQTALPGLPFEFRHFTTLPEARAWAGGN